MGEPNYISITEFRDFGYLQEVNRRILHPLGLALAVSVDEATGEAVLAGLWDGRDDLEGYIFADELLDPEKTSRVAVELARRATTRISRLGYVVQPAGEGREGRSFEDLPDPTNTETRGGLGRDGV